jgi:hypothetical protein
MRRPARGLAWVGGAASRWRMAWKASWRKDKRAGGAARCVGGIVPQCVERADVLLGEKHADVLAALCAAREVSVQIVGKAGRPDTSKPIFLADAKAICEAHQAP